MEMNEHESNLPVWLAVQIQEHIVKEANLNDYTIGMAERSDMATDYVVEHLSKRVEPPSLAYDALTKWFEIYGRDLRDGSG